MREGSKCDMCLVSPPAGVLLSNGGCVSAFSEVYFGSYQGDNDMAEDACMPYCCCVLAIQSMLCIQQGKVIWEGDAIQL